MIADFYEVLGVSKDADFDAIRSAYKSAAKRSHPDRGGTAEEFESVRRAYECLCDPAQREAYDRTRSSGEKKRPTKRTQKPSKSSEPQSSGSSAS
jgi:DnaJ-class molecular chaperone